MNRGGNGNSGGGTALANRPRPGRDALDAGEPREVVDARTDTSVLAVATRAELDAQVATAKAFPRSIKRALDDAETLATMDEITAAACTYSLPRDGKTISGPSVRLAEILASCWGNLRVSARILEETATQVRVEGLCIDTEKNLGIAVQVARRITRRDGRRYGDDMIATTTQAAISIAFRNAVFRVIPSVFVNRVWMATKQVAAGQGETFTQNRDGWLRHFTGQGIKQERVLEAIGVRGVEDMTFEHVSVLMGLDQAIRDRETTLDEAFPIPSMVGNVERQPGESKTSALKRSMQEQQQKAKEAPRTLIPDDAPEGAEPA